MQNYYKINSKSLSILKGTDSEVVFNAVAVTLCTNHILPQENWQTKNVLKCFISA